MTFALACAPKQSFAAFGGVGASFYRPVCNAAPPAPIIYFHGTADPVVPYEGGRVAGSPARSITARVTAANQNMADWANHNGAAQRRTSATWATPPARCGLDARTTRRSTSIASTAAGTPGQVRTSWLPTSPRRASARQLRLSMRQSSCGHSLSSTNCRASTLVSRLRIRYGLHCPDCSSCDAGIGSNRRTA